MCRLFGAISKTELDAEHLLSGAPQSLLFQSRVDKKRPQGDGWGIGWIERGRPKIIKSPRALYKETVKLERAARRVKGNVLIGHVRWASNPLKLPKHDLIGLIHTQPFRYKNWVFAHNGTLLIPKEVRAELGPLTTNIEGNNDSEVLFFWLMKYLLSSPRRKPGSSGFNAAGFRLTTAGMTEVRHKIRHSIMGLQHVWKKCRKKYPLYKYPFHGLNWVLTNGKVMIAQCYTNPAGFGKAKALVRKKEPYYQLRYKHDASGWLVASEPLDFDPAWKTMRHGQMLITDGQKGWFSSCC